MTQSDLATLEQHLRWMVQQTSVAGHDLQYGVRGAITLLDLVPQRIDDAVKPPGAYWHRAEADDPWDLAMVTKTGAIIFIGTDALYRGEDARGYMSSGEWWRLPGPPAPGEIVAD